MRCHAHHDQLLAPNIKQKGPNPIRRWGSPFQMARVYPRVSSSSISTIVSPVRETFTVWMKSLVLHGNGFTIFNSRGEIVYRIDNYDTKRNREVFLMDLRGNVLCTLLQRKRRVLEQWDVHKFDGNGKSGRRSGEKPWFRVRKIGQGFLSKRVLACQVTVESNELSEESRRYQIKGSMEKSEFNIIDQFATVIAEVRRKKLERGVTLGKDVLSLVVEPLVDPSFVAALVAVVGLLSHTM